MARLTRLLNRISGGQSTLEYAVFTAVISAALVTMGIYVKRAIQANLKQVEDRVNADAAAP